MAKKNYNVIGVMSGTSLDGVDIAFAKIVTAPAYKAYIITAETIAYPDFWTQKLSEAVHFSKAELEKLNIDYTRFLSQLINDFITKHALTELDAVCSHGHTVLHKPNQGYTLQIGNLPLLGELVSHKIVCDFRVQDVTLGGQGAPLVPIGDQLLFGAYDYCLNLGGFANVSSEVSNRRLAYDICPVNTVLNVYAQQLGAAYDAGGAFAKAGKIHTSLLEKLNALPFYNQLPPKSLGIEWVHEHIFPLINTFELSPREVLATFTEHVAIQLANQFKTAGKLLVTGGGAYNQYLLERLQILCDVTVVIPENALVEFKEALVFALLGVLKLEGQNNCFASVTGASRNHSSGVIYG